MDERTVNSVLQSFRLILLIALGVLFGIVIGTPAVGDLATTQKWLLPSALIGVSAGIVAELWFRWMQSKPNSLWKFSLAESFIAIFVAVIGLVAIVILAVVAR